MTTLWRRPTVESETGRHTSSLYEDIQKGLMVRPVKIGGRAVAWPADEVRAINAARIAGKTDDEIRRLVSRLEATRAEKAASLVGASQSA